MPTTSILLLNKFTCAQAVLTGRNQQLHLQQLQKGYRLGLFLLCDPNSKVIVLSLTGIPIAVERVLYARCREDGFCTQVNFRFLSLASGVF